MWFSSWLRRRLSNHVPRNRNPHHFRPRLEALEDRWLPAQIGLTVTSLADSGPGTLRAAIFTADAGSPSDKFTINVNVAGTIDLQSPLPDLNNSIAIQGPGAKSLTVERDAAISFSSAIITVDADQTASLFGLTIANGDHGGIDNTGTLAVSGCIISSNSAVLGGGAGGIFNFGTLTISNSTLDDNSAIDGGAIINWVFSSLTISNSTLDDNTARVEGGGILNYGTATLEQNSTVSGNSAEYGGGVLNRNGGTLTASNSTVSGNSAEYGGGIYTYDPVTVSGCTLSDNSATDGGGIYNNGPDATLAVRGSNFSGNTAADSGGGIYNAGTATILDSTLSGNSASEGAGIYNAALAMLDVRGSTLSGNTASDSGGGIYNLGTATVQESTLSGNTAGSSGGGIFNGASGALTIDDSTVCDNFAALGADLDNLGVATINDSDVCVIGR
jgi:predicted outer membrane repeat protein